MILILPLLLAAACSVGVFGCRLVIPDPELGSEGASLSKPPNLTLSPGAMLGWNRRPSPIRFRSLDPGPSIPSPCMGRLIATVVSVLDWVRAGEFVVNTNIACFKAVV